MLQKTRRRMAVFGLGVVATIAALTVMAARDARSVGLPTEQTMGTRSDGSIAPAHERYRDHDLGLYLFPNAG